MALTITIPGAVEATIGATAPAVLTVGVGTPGATGPAGPAGQGVPVGGTAGQFLTKIDGTNYNTDWTTVNLSAYAVKANNLSDLASASTARTNLGLGTMATATASDYSTTTVANGLYYPLSGNPSAFLTASALTPYATLASPTFTGVPLAPTASTGTSTTQIATTAFVQDAVIAGSAHAETLQATVRNNTGATLSPFTVVYINGALGNNATVAKAQANAESTSAGTFAVTQASISNNADGIVISAGVLSNIDTSAYTDGDKLYLSPTTAGAVTTTKPSAPNHLVYVGVVTRSHPTQGTVNVRIQNGYELGEIHDVALSSVTDNDLLAYEAASGLWKNESFSTLGLLTSSTAASTYAPLASPALTGNVSITTNSASPALFITQSGAGNILQLYDQGSDTTATVIDQNGKITTVLSETANAGFALPHGTAPTSPVNGDVWTTTTGLFTYINGATKTAAFLEGATFTGLVTTPAATTTTAGLNVPHGAAPTSPVNGDIWTTTGGVFARINAGTTQLMNLGSTQTVSGAITFSNATQTLGNSTAASTINVGTGATLTATTKAVNIGTAGVSGSTTNIIVGPVLGASTISIGGTTAASTLNLAAGATLTATTKAINIGTAGVAGSTTTIAVGSATSATTTTVEGTLTANGAALNLGMSTAAATYNLGTGATLTATTKAVNIGTSGVAGSTTNIAIGSTTGTSTTTLQGTTNGITAAADTNSVALATTAYVVGQAGSATPVVDGTAAVGTSLRYARQDHVHPTDTSRAALASPTFTGTPLSTTAAADTNTTQIATTAFVVGQASSTAPVIDGTATVGTSLKYARADHVHPTDTSRAALASPTFTGTPLSTTAAVDTNTTQIATTAYVVGQGYAKLASPTFTGTPTLPTGTIATTQTAGNNTTAVATTAFVTAAVPTFASLTEARQFSSTTKVLSPSLALWSMLSADIIYIDRSNFTVTNVGAVQYTNLGSIATETRLASAAASSSKARTYGASQVDQSQSATVRSNISNYINFSKPTYLSGRSATYDITDAVLTMAFYFGKAEGDAVGDLTRRGIGWKVTGGTGSRFLVLQVHNGTTLTNVTSSFAVTGSVAFDWDIISDGAGNVSLYVNGSSVATSSAGPTTLQNVSPPVIWQEEYSNSATPAITYHTAYHSRGRMAVINY